jgi:acetolactate synthase-1/2/3 large subunit
MTSQEFGAAIQFGARPIVIVADNGMYGTIRMHQERSYPGRPSGTTIVNPDFAAIARAYGGHGETVANNADFAPAFERSLKSGRAALIHVALSPDHITPTSTLGEMRRAARESRNGHP